MDSTIKNPLIAGVGSLRLLVFYKRQCDFLPRPVSYIIQNFL